MPPAQVLDDVRPLPAVLHSSVVEFLAAHVRRSRSQSQARKKKDPVPAWVIRADLDG